jgi:hypothetical protein
MIQKLATGFVIGFAGARNTRAESKIPSDADSACAVSAGDLHNWFAGRTVTKNGKVVPASRASLDDTTACNFYKWRAQMFLWLTTPTGTVLA